MSNEKLEEASSKNFRKTLMLRSIKVSNVLLITAVYGVGWYIFNAGSIVSPFFRRGNYAVIALYLFFYATFGRIYDAFLVSYNRISEMVYSQILAFLEADVVLFIINWLLKKHLPSIPAYLLVLAVQIAVSILWSKCAHDWYFQHFQAKKTYIVWDMRRGMTDLINSYGLSHKFSVVGNCSAQECVEDLSVLDGMEVVFLSGVHSHDRNIIIKYCVANDITAFIIPRIGDVLMSGTKRMHLFHLPILRLDRYNPTPEYLFFKRAFDIIIAAVALVILSPLMLVTAILIKKEDGGPVFYRQCRLTKDGKKFNVLKFRSMRVDAEKDGVARLSTGDKDDRITKVGRKIRAVRIDELPQLFNILKGDMSIVGPRPERPEIAAQYEQEMPEFRLRLQAKCGLTGYAQVYGQYNTTPYDKLQMDLMYIAHPSMAQDLMICFATVKILFLKESTEGVAEGQTTASFQKPERSVKEETDVQTQHIAEEAEQKHNI